jgi:lauroyl/myristoyl acyltransferase
MPPNVRLSRSLPLKCLRIYMRILGVMYFCCRSEERRHILTGLRHGLGFCSSIHRYSNIVAKTFAGICDHYVEKLFNAYRPVSQNMEFLKRCVDIPNKAWIQKIYDQRKGCLMITGHFGAVEFLPLVLSVNGFKIAMIVRYKDQHLKRACEAIGNARDGILIDASEKGVLQAAVSAIRNGRILITQCDEFKHWKPCNKEETLVFGLPVPQDRTLDVLRRRTGVPACLGLMKRFKQRYELLIDPIMEGNDEGKLSEHSWKTLEGYILKYPEQWYEWKAVSKYILPLACK